jgi:hypothetical protein
VYVCECACVFLVNANAKELQPRFDICCFSNPFTRRFVLARYVVRSLGTCFSAGEGNGIRQELIMPPHTHTTHTVHLITLFSWMLPSPALAFTCRIHRLHAHNVEGFLIGELIPALPLAILPPPPPPPPLFPLSHEEDKQR